VKVHWDTSGKTQNVLSRAIWRLAEFTHPPLRFIGTKRLAGKYGFSKQEVREVAEKFADQLEMEGNRNSFEPCYEHRAEKYLSFEEWLDHYLRVWEKVIL
jgi:hypothetical protein